MRVKAFNSATTTAIAPAASDSTLMKPPRTLGESASTIPMNPKAMATNASINPPAGPAKKLQIAAIIAMREGMLKLALVARVSMNQPIDFWQRAPCGVSRKYGTAIAQLLIMRRSLFRLDTCRGGFLRPALVPMGEHHTTRSLSIWMLIGALVMASLAIGSALLR